VVEQLLERGSEVAVLREAVRDAAGGRGSVVLVAGEAGIGKSTLVRTWAADPGEDDARVLVGWCEDLLVRRTYGPLHDLAHRLGGAFPGALAAADTDAVMDTLLARIDDPLRPTVVVLEDVHWADEATLDVVRFVGRRIASRRAVLVLTYRDDELGPGHPLLRVLGAFPGVPVRRIQLRPLSRGAVAQLTAGSGLDPGEVVRLTGGNPFYVTEVAQTSDELPASVLDAVVARLRSLPEPTQRAVGILAVVPRQLPIEEAIATVGDLEVLAPAEDRGIVTVEDGRVRFRHELTRRAVLESLPTTTAVTYHELVLARTLERDGDRDELLHHAAAAGRIDLVVAHGPEAAHEAFEAGAHLQAAARQEQVLRHAERLDPRQLADLLVERAWSLYNLHHFHDAERAAARCVALNRQLGDRGPLCRVLLTHSRMLYMINRLDDAFAVLDEAEQLLPGLAPVIVMEHRVNRLSLLQLADRHREVIEEADAAIQAARELDRGDMLAHAQNYLGCAIAAVGDLEEGLAGVRRAVRTGLDTGWWEAAARGYTNLVELLGARRGWDEFDAAVEEAVAFYEDHDFSAHRYNTLGQRALSLVLRGRWTAADHLLTQVEQAVHGAGVLEAIPLHARALLAVRAGTSDAGDVLERAWEVATASRSAQYLVPVAAVGIEWAWTRDDPALADRFVVPALEAVRETRWGSWLRWRLRLVRQVTGTGAVPVEPEATSLRGQLDDAVTGWRRLAMPYELALELLRRGEERDVLEAVTILDGLGAVPAGRVARRRSRELGVTAIPRRPQPATRANPAGLTARQLEVLQLLAAGFTNAQIAEQLVVSIRTVDHHVSAVLHKLDVPSRERAAAVARELGVVHAEADATPDRRPPAVRGVGGTAAPPIRH
jgi:DNA-binding CsgD family transcriptional regulator/tetratricopeptide (TPR) repeat protein